VGITLKRVGGRGRVGGKKKGESLPETEVKMNNRKEKKAAIIHWGGRGLGETMKGCRVPIREQKKGEHNRTGWRGEKGRRGRKRARGMVYFQNSEKGNVMKKKKGPERKGEVVSSEKHLSRPFKRLKGGKNQKRRKRT